MSNLNFNIFNLIIISGVLHGMIFSAIVLVNKRNNANNIFYLGLVVLLLSLSNLQYWIIDTEIILVAPILKYIFVPWQWLVLPMFYLYVYSFIGKNSINPLMKRYLLSPFIVIFTMYVGLILYKLLMDQNYELPSHFERGIYVYIEFASIIFNLTIIYFTYRLVDRHEKDETYDLKWVKSETNWLKKLLILGLVICIFWVTAISIIAIFNLNTVSVFYPMWIGISILVYWIGYVGINKSNQLKKRIELRKKRIIDFNKKSETSYKASPAFDKIIGHILTHKIYLNPNASLDLLSSEMDLSEGYISQLLNQNSEKNFNDYINEQRVEDAKSMLADDEYDQYTIVSIGLESGFNSKSSFYSAFKKFTGQTPNEFKKGVRNL